MYNIASIWDMSCIANVCISILDKNRIFLEFERQNSTIFALANGESPGIKTQRKNFLKKSCSKIWSVLEKGIIFAPLSLLKRNGSKNKRSLEK